MPGSAVSPQQRSVRGGRPLSGAAVSPRSVCCRRGLARPWHRGRWRPGAGAARRRSDRLPLLRPAGPQPRSPRPLLPAQQRAGTMSAETATGPTEDQVEILEYNFNKVDKHPDSTTLCLIAAEAGLSEEETQKWFKQRLAKWRRSEGLPSECRSVTD
ncbi:hypothetical protein H8959_009103 [Pygathrix nigripes]